MAKRTRRTLQQRLTEERGRLELEQLRLKRQVLKEHRRRQAALSTYAAAEKHRLTEDWPSKTLSADTAIINDARILTARARQAQRDNWMADSACGAFRRSVVGIGLTPKSVAVDPASGDETPQFERFNRQIDRLWRRWARKRQWCDVERKKAFIEIEGLAVEEFVVAGEAFAIMCYVPREDMVGLCIQMFEAEQLDTQITRNPTNGNEVRGGIEIDAATGATVAYWVYIAGYDTQRALRSASSRIPAERVEHIFRQRRVRQTRGVTKFASTLIKMRHTQMYEEYQLIGARLEACQGGAIQTDRTEGNADYGLPPDTGDADTDSYGADEIIMEPGMMPRLPAGESINWRPMQRPGNQYDPYIQSQASHIGAGVGLDYAQIARDFTKGSFSSQRQGGLENDKETDPLQVLFIDSLCRPVREAFKLYAVLEGRVAAPGFFGSPEMTAAYLEDVWQGPPKPWIDPAKQAAAAKIKIDYRLATRREILNEQGKYYDEEIAQHGVEQRLAEEEGVYLPDAQAKGSPPVAPQEPRPDKKQPEENEPEKNAQQSAAPEPDVVTDAVIVDAVGPELAFIVEEN